MLVVPFPISGTLVREVLRLPSMQRFLSSARVRQSILPLFMMEVWTDPSAFSVIGPIVGGFVAENPRLGWRFNFWLIFIFSGFVIALGYFVTPETVSLPCGIGKTQILTSAIVRSCAS